MSPLVIINSMINNRSLKNCFLTKALAVEPRNKKWRLEGIETKPIYSKSLRKLALTPLNPGSRHALLWHVGWVWDTGARAPKVSSSVLSRLQETESDFDNCAVCIEGYKPSDIVRILPCRWVTRLPALHWVMLASASDRLGPSAHVFLCSCIVLFVLPFPLRTLCLVKLEIFISPLLHQSKSTAVN